MPDSPRRPDRLLLICPVIVLASFAVGLMSAGDTDYVRAMAWQALIVELAVIYLPARRFIEAHGGGAAFGLKPVSLPELLWACLLGIGVFFAATALNAVSQLVLQALSIDLSGLSVPLPQASGWRLPALILLMAIIPAFAEEVLFRGALLHAWLPRGSRRSVWHTALLFALIHLQPASLPALIPLGLLLGAVTLVTGSIYPAMAVHLINNLIALLLTSAAGVQEAAAAVPDAAQLLPVVGLYLFVGLAGGVPSFFGLKAAARLRRERAEQTGQADPPPLPANAKQPPSYEMILTYTLLVLFNAAYIAALFLAPGR